MELTIRIHCPDWVRKVSRVALPSLAIGVAGVTLAVPTKWKSGDALTAEDLNANFTDVDSTLSSLDTRTTALETAKSADEATLASLGAKVTSIQQTPLAAAMFHVSTTCQTPGGTAMDCTCPAGQIAIAGGGWCGSNAMQESANPPLGTGRQLDRWRVSCANAIPQNYYALCVSAP
jgi:hypothetical protein